MNMIKVIDDWLETAQLICTKTDGKAKYEFSKFTFPLNISFKNLELRSYVTESTK